MEQDKQMIRYNHSDDLNTWFIQAKDDDVPSWAVNIEDYEPDTMEPDAGHRCDNCRHGKLKQYGYSSWTIEGTTFSCVLERHPDRSFDRWYGEDNRLKYANKCSFYREGSPIKIGVGGELM